MMFLFILNTVVMITYGLWSYNQGFRAATRLNERLRQEAIDSLKPK